MLSIVIIPSFHKLNSENYPQTIIESLMESNQLAE